MTEKEFLLKLVSMDMETEAEIRNICKEALRLAKERGAKFDPEPVDLPELRVVGHYALGDRDMVDARLKNPRFVEGFGETYLLSSSQAEEVIYRCKKWDLIRKIVKSMARCNTEFNQHRFDGLLSILEKRPKTPQRS